MDRMRVAKRSDYRISVMNELIQGIQVIKMYAWERPFRTVVKNARQKEVDQIQWASYIRGIYLSTMVFTERSTLFIAIVACIYEGRAITADLVFSMATFFNVLQLTAAIFYPMAVSMGAEALVSLTLINKERTNFIIPIQMRFNLIKTISLTHFYIGFN
jgi:ATP-binding cassette, subfamily C (CFTR/MRP), member 4